MIPHFRGKVVSQGQYFIFGALCPSKSGLMNKHIVKHIVSKGSLACVPHPYIHACSQHPWVQAIKAANQTNKLDCLSCHCPVRLGCVVLLEQVWESEVDGDGGGSSRRQAAGGMGARR